MQEVTPSAEEQSLVQGLCTKVSTVMENMIVTGEGEELVLFGTKKLHFFVEAILDNIYVYSF